MSYQTLSAQDFTAIRSALSPYNHHGYQPHHEVSTLLLVSCTRVDEFRCNVQLLRSHKSVYCFIAQQLRQMSPDSKNITLNGTFIEPVSAVRNRIVLIDAETSTNAHVSKVVTFSTCVCRSRCIFFSKLNKTAISRSRYTIAKIS